MSQFWYADLGRVRYSECLTTQHKIAEARRRGEIPDVLLLLEHTPVITFGRAGGSKSLLASPEELRREGIEVFHTDRGGDATYHGPGQLVGYPIFDLTKHGRDVHLFLRKIEQAIVACLLEFGISAGTRPGLTGVWVRDEKICSIGIAVRRWISYHGFALNVNPNFNHWSLLHPCGLIGCRVTSIERLIGHDPEMELVKETVVESFVRVFNMAHVAVERELLPIATAVGERS